MPYKVVEKFRDLEDNEHIYDKNDVYPREEIKIEDIDKKRLKELSTKKNKIGKVLIVEVENTAEKEEIENTAETINNEENERKEEKNIEE